VNGSTGHRELLEGTASTEAQRRTRVLGAAVGMACAGVLAVAAWLTPDPDGFGTHLQLGLAPCTMLQWTGWPCPMCGMTTTFALLAHGRLVDGALNQPFGVVLFSMTGVLAVAGLTDAATGRGWLTGLAMRALPHELKVGIGLLSGLAAGWMYKCVQLHPEIFG
jgi:hypothetical protein